MSKLFALISILAVCLLFLVIGPASAKDIRIGVLNIRGAGEDANKSWQQIADHLSNKISAQNFIIVPHNYDELEQAVAHDQLEFVVANPSQYIEFSVKYGVSRIATQVSYVGKAGTPYVGSVIFTKGNRTDITSLSDLRGKSLVSASKNAFASWFVTRDEMKRQGVLTENLASVKFTGSADKVVLAVKNGEADAGAVLTQILEKMEQEGKIVLTDFRILNQKHVDGFPFLLSSELYPNFAFARLKHTDMQLANNVAAQLLLMSQMKSDNRYPNLISWSVPDNYDNVRNLLQEWRVKPFEEYGKITLREAVRQHWVTIVLGLTSFSALVLIIYLSQGIKQRRIKYDILNEAKQKLELVNTMIEANPDAVFIKDKQGHYIFVNPQAARIFGKPAEEIIGKLASDLFPPEVAQSMVDTDSTVLSSASTITYEKLYSAPDPPRNMLVTKGPIFDCKGEVESIFAVARDITDLKNLQEEISDKVVQLETALSAVRQLEGIIPICSYCNKIRDDKESWQQMEQYITGHSEATFSHGVCPECYERALLDI